MLYQAKYLVYLPRQSAEGELLDHLKVHLPA